MSTDFIEKNLVPSENFSEDDFDPMLWPTPLDESSIVATVSIDVDPQSKSRPIFSKGRAYTPDKTRQYEKMLAFNFRASLTRQPTASDRFGVRAVFRKETLQRIDVDNMLKAVFDAANDVVWLDDSQCVEVMGKVLRGAPSARIDVVFYLLPDPSPTYLCPKCNIRFRVKRSRSKNGPPVYCGQECFRAAQTDAYVDMKCRQCDGEFELCQSLAKLSAGFCSKTCSLRFYGALRKAAGSDTWKCQDCGSAVTRKEYEVCKHCSMKRRANPQSHYRLVRMKKKDPQAAV